MSFENKTKYMKIVLYVLYFDEDSHQKAVHDFQAIPYARYLYI